MICDYDSVSVRPFISYCTEAQTRVKYLVIGGSLKLKKCLLKNGFRLKNEQLQNCPEGGESRVKSQAS